MGSRTTLDSPTAWRAATAAQGAIGVVAHMVMHGALAQHSVTVHGVHVAPATPRAERVARLCRCRVSNGVPAASVAPLNF